MTNITLTIIGAKSRACVSGPLTSGMVGIPVTVEYDDAWKGLTKNLVCRCGKWGAESGETRTVLDIGTSAAVAHEVMQAGMHLFLGVEGHTPDGKLVMPTTWADCGKILPGANANADPSADLKLSVWTQLQTEINQLKKQPITETQIAAGIAAYLAENPIEAPEAPQSSALTSAQIAALDGMFKIAAYAENASAAYAAFQTAFGIGGDSSGDSGETEVILTGISATYRGGSVPVGTAVADLTGIVVTARYSDGTSEAVTGYTLSGTIAEGSNIITVTYQGMTAVFTVTGAADSGGEDTGVSNETAWTDGVAYTFTTIPNEYPDKNTGEIKAYSGWGRTPYLYCKGASKLRVTAITDSPVQQGATDNAFYDADKNHVGTFGYAMSDSVTLGAYVDIDIPETAAYFILSGNSERMRDDARKLSLTPYA